uniref:TNF receptor-associated factor n=1 Tax=Naja naja TaxID=35670 RepID=A0A8C6XGE7_NAJNA
MFSLGQCGVDWPVSVLNPSLFGPPEAFPDNAARREVESLPAICPHQGCLWKGTIKEYESCHEGSCPAMLVACPACHGLVRLGEKEQHAEQECPERSLSCKYCQALFQCSESKAHEAMCPKFPLACEGCGKKKIPREKFLDHVKTCSKCRAPCRFQPVGCTHLMENEKLPEHERSHLGEHLYMLLSFVLSLGSASSKLEPLLDRLSAEAGCVLAGGRPLVPEAELPSSLELLGKCEGLERKTVTFENIVCVLNREVEKVSLVAEAASRQHQLDQEKIEALGTKVGRGWWLPGGHSERDLLSSSWPGGSRRGEGALGSAAGLCAHPFLGSQSYCEPRWCLPGSGAAAGEEHRLEGPGPGRDGARHAGDGGGLLRRHLHLEDFGLCPEAAGGSGGALSGHLLPRWEDPGSDLGWAREGLQPQGTGRKETASVLQGFLPALSLCSARPAFYTSKYGYKMCLRIYLNGDGTGRGTHLSLFFVVMKGPNDSLLRWPFNQKVGGPVGHEGREGRGRWAVLGFWSLRQGCPNPSAPSGVFLQGQRLRGT